MNKIALRSTLSLLLLLFGVCTARGQGDVIGQAQNLVNQLNPANLALGPLVDNAIDHGNTALAQRLEQLRSIIQEALFNLNKIITEQSTRINSQAAGRLSQLNIYVNNNLQLLNSIASGQVTDIDDDIARRIEQFGNTTGNLVEALPIPSQPLPNVPSTGFSLVRSDVNLVPLFITGAGLRKGGASPKAYILNGDSGDKHYLSHDGTEVMVKTASMGLIELEIPASLFPSGGSVEKTLLLKLRSGNIIPTTVEPSFPLLLCSRLPEYSLVITQEAIGQIWDKRVVEYPSLTSVPDRRVYITDGGSNASVNVCADDADTVEWKSDPDVATYGLEYAGVKEHIGATLVNNPRNGCVRLYAGKDSSGGGFATIWGLQVRQRRLKQGSCGIVSSQPIKLKYGSLNSIETRPQDLLDNCVSSTAGATITPSFRVHISIIEDQNPTADQINLTQNVPAKLLDGTVTATVDQFGLLKLTVTPKCGRKTTDYSRR